MAYKLHTLAVTIVDKEGNTASTEYKIFVTTGSPKLKLNNGLPPLHKGVDLSKRVGDEAIFVVTTENTDKSGYVALYKGDERVSKAVMLNPAGNALVSVKDDFLDMDKLPDGEHTVKARFTDDGGNYLQSDMDVLIKVATKSYISIYCRGTQKLLFL